MKGKKGRNKKDRRPSYNRGRQSERNFNVLFCIANATTVGIFANSAAQRRANCIGERECSRRWTRHKQPTRALIFN